MKKIICLILLFGICFFGFTFVSGESYVLGLNYNKGNISFLSLNIGLEQPGESQGDYTADILSFNNKTLNRTFFSVSTFILVDIVDESTGSINGGGIFNLTQVNFTLYLPYYENAKEIKIYDPDMTLMLTIPVSQFSKDLCGDGTCQFYESERSCAADCAVPKVNVTAAEKEKGIVEKATQYVEENQTMFIVSLIVLVILIIIIILLLKTKHKSVEKAS